MAPLPPQWLHKKKPRRRQGSEQERFRESVLVSTPEVGSSLLTRQNHTLGVWGWEGGGGPLPELSRGTGAPPPAPAAHSRKGITCSGTGPMARAVSMPPPPPRPGAAAVPSAPAPLAAISWARGVALAK